MRERQSRRQISNWWGLEDREDAAMSLLKGVIDTADQVDASPFDTMLYPVDMGTTAWCVVDGAEDGRECVCMHHGTSLCR